MTDIVDPVLLVRMRKIRDNLKPDAPRYLTKNELTALIHGCEMANKHEVTIGRVHALIEQLLKDRTHESD